MELANELRWYVRRGPREPVSRDAVIAQRPGQSKITDQRRAADDQDVLRFDVAMLNGDVFITQQMTGLVEEVNGASRLLHVLEQLCRGNTRPTLLFAFAQPIE